MSHKIKISIPEPCHENWLEMSPTEKGRFCSSCQKNVMDFTKSSDREIIKEFNTSTDICGRFLVSQTNRELSISKEKKSIWLATVSTIISLLSSGNQELLAQGSAKKEQTENKINTVNILKENENENENDNENDNEEIEINGQIIIDDTNPNFEEVEIPVYNKNKIFHPSADGTFCFTANKKDSLIFSKTGFDNYNTIVYKLSKFAYIEFFKENERVSNSYTVGGAYAVKKRIFWYRLFHKN